MVTNDYYCIIAVRDNEESISDVIYSIIHQSVPPKKIIIVNDGSSDKTGQILEKFTKNSSSLIEIIQTNNKTRDYARIPSLWNLCLRKNYDYFMIGAGDCIFEHHYAEKILSIMKREDIVVCSGSDGITNNKMPRGAGRFIKQSYFFDQYEKFLEIVGYESEILERALTLGYKIKVVNDSRFTHFDKLGHGHHFKEFGMGMKALGYYPPYVYGRFIKNFFQNPEIGKKGALQMLFAYIKFKPEKTGYYSSFPKELQTQIRNRQKLVIKSIIKRLIFSNK